MLKNYFFFIFKLFLFLWSGIRIRNPHSDETLDPDLHKGLCGSETLVADSVHFLPQYDDIEVLRIQIWICI